MVLCHTIAVETQLKAEEKLKHGYLSSQPLREIIKYFGNSLFFFDGQIFPWKDLPSECVSTKHKSQPEGVRIGFGRIDVSAHDPGAQIQFTLNSIF